MDKNSHLMKLVGPTLSAECSRLKASFVMEPDKVVVIYSDKVVESYPRGEEHIALREAQQRIIEAIR